MDYSNHFLNPSGKEVILYNPEMILAKRLHNQWNSLE